MNDLEWDKYVQKFSSAVNVPGPKPSLGLIKLGYKWQTLGTWRNTNYNKKRIK